MTPETATGVDADRSDLAPSGGGRVTRLLLEPSRFHLVLIVVLLGMGIALAVWRSVSVHRLEEELGASKAEARDALYAQAGELLELSAIPLAWAIRASVLSKDVGDIDAYMDKLVREKFVKRIVFVDATGTIVSSTNTKLKDQPAAAALPGIDLAATTPRVDRTGDDLRIVVPVMSYERQVGTLLLDYSTSRSIETKLAR